MKHTFLTPRRRRSSWLDLRPAAGTALRRSSSPWVPAGLGLAAGAALLYWLDPQRGARRRAEVKQKAIHAMKETGSMAGVTARDLAHRSRGLFAEVRASLEGAREVPDDAVLEERVRAHLGRLCSHPSSIEVHCQGGRVELKGPILEAEVGRVLRGISRVRGVREIDDDLAVHAAADGVPGLQGPSRPGSRPELLQQHWSPSAQVLAGAAGLGLLGMGIARRGTAGIAAGAAGAGLLLRSLTNLPIRRLLGLGAGRRAIDLRKAIHVHASPEEVFAFFRRFENFPRFMTHVREVAPLGEGRWRWSVTGPANVPVSWEAEITKLVPDQLIAWRSVPGSTIRNAGTVRFEPDRGGTRIDVRLSYNPPAGAIGHAFAALFGADPKKQLDDDLVRFKSLVEVGKATGREGTVTRDQLSPGPPA